VTELLNLVDVLKKKHRGHSLEETLLEIIVQSLGKDGINVVALQTRIEEFLFNKSYINEDLH